MEMTSPGFPLDSSREFRRGLRMWELARAVNLSTRYMEYIIVNASRHGNQYSLALS